MEIHPGPGVNCACPLCVPEKYLFSVTQDNHQFTVWQSCDHCYCQYESGGAATAPHRRCCKCGVQRMDSCQVVTC